MKADEDLVGIRGWLIFLAINMIVTPFSLMYFTYSELAPIFAYDSSLGGSLWELATDPDSEFFIENFKLHIVSTLTLQSLLLMISSYAAVLFFTTKKDFLFWGKLKFLSIVASHIIAFLLFLMILPASEYFTDDFGNFDNKFVRDIVREVAWSLIWFLYLIRSKRVQATFVN